MPYKDKEKEKEAKRRYDAKRAGRTRNFATVVYPESAPADWLDKLDAYHVAALVSPLHDRDTNPSGEIKKPHYHVLLLFDGPKEFETQIKPIFDEIGGVGRETVASARGYARYLCHLDNPEKAQYDPADVRSFGGANYFDITNLPTDDVKLLAEMMQFIREAEIYSFAEFLEVCQIHNPQWFSVAALSRGWVIKEYIKSLTWERDTGYTRAADRAAAAAAAGVDPRTGEVVAVAETSPDAVD